MYNSRQSNDSEFTDAEIESLKEEIKNFKETFLYSLFVREMKEMEEQLYAVAIPGNLTDIGSVFVRENALGEMRAYGNQAKWFDTLQQQLNTIDQ